jgi:hypothetical protein
MGKGSFATATVPKRKEGLLTFAVIRDILTPMSLICPSKALHRLLRLGSVLLLALCTLPGWALANSEPKPEVEAGWPPLETSGGFAPTVLPADHRVPVAITLAVKQTSSTTGVGLQREVISFDRSFGLDPGTSSSCARVYRTQDRRFCRPMVVGEGIVGFRSPESSSSVNERLKIAGRGGKNPTLTLLSVATGDHVGIIRLRKRPEGGVRWAFSAAPRPDGLELDHLRVTLTRYRIDGHLGSVITARCSNGKLTAVVSSYALSDGRSFRGEPLVRLCKPAT